MNFNKYLDISRKIVKDQLLQAINLGQYQLTFFLPNSTKPDKERFGFDDPEKWAKTAEDASNSGKFECIYANCLVTGAEQIFVDNDWFYSKPDGTWWSSAEIKALMAQESK